MISNYTLDLAKDGLTYSVSGRARRPWEATMKTLR